MGAPTAAMPLKLGLGLRRELRPELVTGSLLPPPPQEARSARVATARVVLINFFI
jgi:hypothetical protein